MWLVAVVGRFLVGCEHCEGFHVLRFSLELVHVLVHHFYRFSRCAFITKVSVEDPNPLTPNDPYRGRTAPLTSKVAFCIFIQQILVLSILNMVYTLRFFLFKMQFVS